MAHQWKAWVKVVLRIMEFFILPGVVFGVAFHVGYDRGHGAGRIEMKCAILRVVERLGDAPEPAPKSIMRGC